MGSDISIQNSRPVCLGKYRILRHIASGAMGAVYEGLDPDTGQKVALKVISPDLIAGKPKAVERFRHEAELGKRLRHENIVALYDYGEAADGCHYHVLELVEGEYLNLLECIKARGHLDPAEARRIVIQIARALNHAHRYDLVHRDVKPANILLTEKDGELVAKLADFGLAREVSDEEFRLTREGTTVGTVDYMAPEQAMDSHDATICSDIYSLGCTLFHMLAGVPPFNEGSLTERLYKHLRDDPPDVRSFNPDVPPDLVAVLRRMLEKKPKDRYQTPEDLLHALSRKPRAARRDGKTPGQEPTAPSRPTARDKPTKVSGPSRRTVAEPARPPAAVSGCDPIAAGKFEWAGEQLKKGNHGPPVIEALLACCQIDPTNQNYHRAVRVALKAADKGKPNRGGGGLLKRVRAFAAWVRLKLARGSQDHGRVLALGEAVLARDPGDLDTHLAMAEAAQALRASDLAVWLLTQACEHDGSDRAAHRALGRLYEKLGDYEQAIAAWEEVRRKRPDDSEAAGMLRDLAALRTVQKNRQRQTAEQDPASSAGD